MIELLCLVCSGLLVAGVFMAVFFAATASSDNEEPDYPY